MIPQENVEDKIQELLTELLAKCDCKNDGELLQVIGALIGSVGMRMNNTYGKDMTLQVLYATVNLVIGLNNKKVVVQ